MHDSVMEYNPICHLPSWESQILLDVSASLQHPALQSLVWAREMGMAGKTGTEK